MDTDHGYARVDMTYVNFDNKHEDCYDQRRNNSHAADAAISIPLSTL